MTDSVFISEKKASQEAFFFWIFRGAKETFRACERGQEYFALRREVLLPVAAKVPKNAIQTCGLKIRPRYTLFVIGAYFHAFTEQIPCRAG